MINDLIKQVLEGTNVPSFYLERPKDIFPCLAYEFTELEPNGADNKDEQRKYDVYINLYIKEDIGLITEKVRKVLKENGFKKILINSPEIFENLDYYQVIFNCKKIIKGDD